MTSIVVNGLSLEKHVKKIYEDLLALKQKEDSRNAEKVLSPEMISNIRDEIMRTLKEYNILSVRDELNSFKQKHNEDLADLGERLTRGSWKVNQNLDNTSMR